MNLREFFYFDKETMEPIEDARYDADDDQSDLKLSDVRKTRLTLKDINKARRADDAHRKEVKNDLSYVKNMYKAPPTE